MKRFALNKIKIAKLVKVQEIKGRGVDTREITFSIDLQATCTNSNILSCVTNITLEGNDVTDPLGTGTDTIPL